MQNKPALLSWADSERLGLITIKSDEIFSLCKAVKPAKGILPDDLPGYKLHPNMITTDLTHQTGTTTNKPNPQSCNHQEHLSNDSPSLCKPPPLPSKPITIPATRNLPPPGQLGKDDILQEYSDNFNGLGCLAKCKDNVTPVQMPVHRVPVPKRAKEKTALDPYEQAGIIKKVEEPTPWCSNELIKETPKKFRVCIDPSQTVNKVILRPIHQMPTLNEQLHKVCNAKCFSMLDVREGFLHIPLDDHNAYLLWTVQMAPLTIWHN